MLAFSLALVAISGQRPPSQCEVYLGVLCGTLAHQGKACYDCIHEEKNEQILSHLCEGSEEENIFCNKTNASRTKLSFGPIGAVEAYIFALPLVLVNVTLNATYPMANTLVHTRDLPVPGPSPVIRPNLDTLYSTASVDLVDGPVILKVPNTKGRFFLFQMMDAWTNTFASPSARVNGTEGGTWAVCPMGWQGTLPPGAMRFDAPTRFVWIIGRTQIKGEDDLPAVHALQDKYQLRTLTPSTATSTNLVQTAVENKLTPPQIVDAMSAETFWSRACDLMANGDAFSPPDTNEVDQLASLSIIVGKQLDWKEVPVATQLELGSAGPLARAAINAGEWAINRLNRLVRRGEWAINRINRLVRREVSGFPKCCS
jgi:hypothetical protein